MTVNFPNDYQKIQTAIFSFETSAKIVVIAIIVNMFIYDIYFQLLIQCLFICITCIELAGSDIDISKI